MSIPEAIASLVAAKRSANRRPEYLRNLEAMLMQASRFWRMSNVETIDQLGLAEIESWLDQAGSLGLRATRLAKVSVLMAWMEKRGMIQTNPCRRIERPHYEHGRPGIWDCDTCRRVLSMLRPEERPTVVLGLFAGLRPTEVERLDWSAVKLRDVNPVVVVDAAASKVRRRRIVPLRDAAVAFLLLDAVGAGSILRSRDVMQWCRRRVVRSGIPWPMDVCRHTYASMRIAGGAPAGAVALEMGNSEGVLFQHYRELVTPEESEQFWRLRPG